LLQIETLKQLQRLYDELVEKANECRLDRYAAFEKSSRQVTLFFCAVVAQLLASRMFLVFLELWDF